MRLRLLVLSLLLTSIAFASENAHQHTEINHNHTSKSIPAGVMRSHIHHKGETMFMYSANQTISNGIRGSQESVLSSYDNAPKNMNMQMHMAGLMHGITEKLTVSAMFQYMKMDMEMTGHDTGTHGHKVSGIGDTSLDAMYRIFSNETHHFQANLGIILPTGSTTQSHEMHANHGMGLHTHTKRNAYNMQLGTGSYSITPGVSYTFNFAPMWQIGTQANATIRLNDNNQNYRFGNIYNLTSWVNRNINNTFSLSARLDYTTVGTIHGNDSQIDPTLSPVNNPSLTYRDQLTALIGGNINLHGKFSGTRIQAEIGTPLYQRIGQGIPKQRFVANIGLLYSL